MKTTIEEYDEVFFVNFTAETAKEASLLARMAINHTKRGMSMYITAEKETVSGYIEARKHSEVRTYIKRATP